MKKEFDFMWLAHPTKKYRTQGKNKIKFEINTPLPAFYIENSDYTLELWMRDVNTDDWVYKSNKITTTNLTIQDQSGTLPCGKKIPKRYWAGPIIEFIKRGVKIALDSKKQLSPLFWWPALIIASFLLSNYMNFEDLLAAINTLISENSSIPTISLGGIAYSISLTIYFLIPNKFTKIEWFFHSVATNFYGLLVGAMSFVISSRMIEIITRLFPEHFSIAEEYNRTIKSLIGELVYLLLFALLCQYLYGLFILMNKHTSIIDRIRLLTSFALVAILFVVTRHWLA